VFHHIIPGDIASKGNCLIELSANGLEKKYQTLLKHSFRVKLFENLGSLKVIDEDGVPLPMTYVKVYSTHESG
jgi:hypothetical protein